MENLFKSNIEKRLFLIWKNALNVENIEENDSLFEIGGNSLIAIMILHDIEKEFNVSLDPADLLKLNTIPKQAKEIENKTMAL